VIVGPERPPPGESPPRPASFLVPPQEIGGNHYVDGGARMVAPLKPAIDDGADRVVVVACQAVDPAP
jgi:predicted patatin/cPLA2 family phospholipase